MTACRRTSCITDGPFLTAELVMIRFCVRLIFFPAGLIIFYKIGPFAFNGALANKIGVY